MSEPFTAQHVLYRLYDEEEELLYVGITKDVGSRFRKHAGEQPWWEAVAACRTEFFPSRLALEAAERAVVAEERPRYNKRLVPPVPQAVDVDVAPPPPPPPPIGVTRLAPAETWRRAGFRLTPKDPNLVISPSGEVLRPHEQRGRYTVICGDKGWQSGGDFQPGHDQCPSDRCLIYEPSEDEVLPR